MIACRAEVAPESFRVGAQVENVRAEVAPELFLVGVQVENVCAEVAPDFFLVGAQVENVVCRCCACTVLAKIKFRLRTVLQKRIIEDL